MNAQQNFRILGEPSHSLVLENQRLLRSVKGRLLDVKASNHSTTARYLQLHDTIAALVDAEVPLFSVPIPALGFVNLHDFTFGTGITVAISGLPDLYLAVVTPCGWFYAETK